MEGVKRITSLAQVRSLDDVVLTECYVVGLGFSGMTAISERPLPHDNLVRLDVTFTNPEGKLEGETVPARVRGCARRGGAYLLSLAFVHNLEKDPGSRLARFIRRELGGDRRPEAPPRHREAAAGSA